MTYSQEVYYWRKEHGICVQCGKHEATRGTRCAVCAAEQAERSWQRRQGMTEEDRQKKNQKRRELSRERRGKGLCRICGKPVYRNYSTCYEHHLYRKRKQKEYAEKKKKGFGDLGKCRICGKDTVTGKKYCEEHLQQYRASMAYAAQFIRKGGENDKGFRNKATV